jgi:DNA-3-methyladenine glycosylase II
VNELYRKACRHLSRRDATLKAVIRRVGPCMLTPRPDEPLRLLVRCVISQQISVKAADSIYAKLSGRWKSGPLTLGKLQKLTAEDFRECGFSGAKVRTIAAILERVVEDKGFLKRLPTLDDDAFRESITSIKGLGPWSADMLLMFGFARLDILPVGDLGLKMGIKDVYGLVSPPSVEEMTAIAEPWRPYRTIASWYMWRARDTK